MALHLTARHLTHPLPARPRPPSSASTDVTPLGFATALGGLAVTAAALVAAMLPGARTATATALMVAAVVAVGALTRAPAAAALVGIAAFAVLDGFGENGTGTLGWHAGDAARLAVLLCAGPAAALVSAAVHASRRPVRR